MGYDLAFSDILELAAKTLRVAVDTCADAILALKKSIRFFQTLPGNGK